MPLYEYECSACHRRTEKIQKFSDPEITACPHCGGVLNRVLSAPAFSLKGGGWYADGYGSAKPAAAATGEGTSGGAPASAGTEGSSSPAGTAAPAPSSTPAPSTPAPSAPAASGTSK